MHAPGGYRPRLTKPMPMRMYVHRRQTQRSATTSTRGISYRRQHSLVSTSDASHGPVPVTLATLSKTSSWHRKGLSSSDAMIRPTPSGQWTRHAASKSASSRSVSPPYATMMAPGLPSWSLVRAQAPRRATPRWAALRSTAVQKRTGHAPERHIDISCLSSRRTYGSRGCRQG